MRLFGTLADRGRVYELKERLLRINPGSAPQWGCGTALRMLQQLAHSYRNSLQPARARTRRRLRRLVDLYGPFGWKERCRMAGRVEPVEFEQARADALDWLARFARSEAVPGAHPRYGNMSHRDWMRWGYLHADHQLRRFGE